MIRCYRWYLSMMAKGQKIRSYCTDTRKGRFGCLENKKVIALYARISKSDPKAPRSQSLVNQTQLMKEYIAQDPFLADMEQKIYQDDGYTGTNLKRPAVRKLLASLCLEKVQVVIVKDFSRLSRNHLQLSELREQVFVRHQVILISIGDGYDSRYAQDGALGIGLRSVFYEYYSRDVSQKVKAALRAKKEAGEYAVSRVPYGYRKGADGWEICDKQAETIRMIFQLAAAGCRSTEITGRLEGDWNARTVWRILQDPVYCGVHVWHKYESVYRNGFYVQPVPRTAWQQVRESHPAIIEEKLFEQVQQCLPRTAAAGRKKGPRHIFTCLTKCAGCRHALCRHRHRREILCCPFCRGECRLQISQELLWRICCLAWEQEVERAWKNQPETGQEKHSCVHPGKVQAEFQKKLFLKQFLQEVTVDGRGCIRLAWNFTKE